MKKLFIICIMGLFSLQCIPQSELPAPSLQLKKVDTTFIVLTWNADAKDALGFVIEKKEDNQPWLIVGQTETGERLFLDQNIAPVVTYYRIRSFGSRSLSDYSNVTVYTSKSK
jgi:hypothetical protein